MFARHARLVQVLRWRREGITDGVILARLTGKAAGRAELARDALAVDPLDELLRDASFDTDLAPQKLEEAGAAFDDAQDPEWNLATRTWIGRIASAIEALGQVGVASEAVVGQVVESLRRAQHALPFDWPADLESNPYLGVVEVAGCALGRLQAWDTEVVRDVRRKGKDSPWYQAFRAMVEEVPGGVPETLIQALVEQGDTVLLRRIPVELWPESALLDALGLDLLDHVGSCVSLTPKELPRLSSLISESEAAVRNLGRLGVRAHVAAPVLEARLRELAEASDPLGHRIDTRAANAAGALEAVGGVGPEALVADASPAVRRVAVRLLALGSSHLDRVLAATEDEDASVRLSATHGLAHRVEDAVEPYLRRALEDAHPRVRWVALELLVERRVDDASELLRDAVTDSDPTVRWAAKRLLRERDETSGRPKEVATDRAAAPTPSEPSHENHGEEKSGHVAGAFHVETARCLVDVRRDPDGVLSVRFHGVLDEHEPLREALRTLQDHVLDRVLVDLSAVEFAAATFSGTLVRISQQVMRAGGRLVCLAPPRAYLRQMEITGLRRVFVMAFDEATARARLTHP